MDPQPASHTPTHFTHLQTPGFIAASILHPTMPWSPEGVEGLVTTPDSYIGVSKTIALATLCY